VYFQETVTTSKVTVVAANCWLDTTPLIDDINYGYHLGFTTPVVEFEVMSTGGTICAAKIAVSVKFGDPRFNSIEAIYGAGTPNGSHQTVVYSMGIGTTVLNADIVWKDDPHRVGRTNIEGTFGIGLKITPQNSLETKWIVKSKYLAPVRSPYSVGV
jgi:hypothetical protein